MLVLMIGMGMPMGVRVHQGSMTMPVGVHKVSTQEQLKVGEDFLRRTRVSNPALFQHEHAISEVFKNLKLMCRCDDGL